MLELLGRRLDPLERIISKSGLKLHLEREGKERKCFKTYRKSMLS
jgi:hypothetical protein